MRARVVRSPAPGRTISAEVDVYKTSDRSLFNESSAEATHPMVQEVISMTSDKKVALVTGANRGIGLETARQLGQQGVTVVVAARSLASAKETAAKLQAEGLDIFPIQLDVTKADDRKAAARTIGDKYDKLDILINNAGVGAEDGMFAAKTIETT